MASLSILRTHGQQPCRGVGPGLLLLLLLTHGWGADLSPPCATMLTPSLPAWLCVSVCVSGWWRAGAGWDPWQIPPDHTPTCPLLLTDGSKDKSPAQVMCL